MLSGTFIPFTGLAAASLIRGSNIKISQYILQVQGTTPKLSPAPEASKAAVESSSVVRLATWTYRLLTFPLWAHRSYVPVGQRLYLNATGDFP